MAACWGVLTPPPSSPTAGDHQLANCPAADNTQVHTEKLNALTTGGRSDSLTESSDPLRLHSPVLIDPHIS